MHALTVIVRWVQQCVKAAGTSTPTALCFLVLLVLANTAKTALFDSLIVESGAVPSPAGLVQGFLNKAIIATVLFIVLFRFKGRSAAVIVYILQAFYIGINLMYYFSFQGYLHVSQYAGLFAEAFELVSHAALPWDVRMLFVVMDLPFFAGALVLYPRVYSLNKRHLFRPVLYGFAVLAIVVFYKWEIPHYSPADIMNNAYESDVTVVKKYGLLIFNIVDLLNYRDARSRIEDFKYGPPSVSTGSPDNRLNVLMLQIESLDARIINYKYKNIFVMPFLHAVSGGSVFFPYMMSYHLAGSTSDCEFSILNSVEPADDFPSMKIRNYDYPNSIVKRFVRNGYSSAAFHGNRGSYFNRNSVFKKIGFQKFYDMAAMGLPEIGWGASDESVFDFAKLHMQGQKQPFFNLIITMSSHEPYTFVRSYYHNRAYDDIRDGAYRNYLNSMAYVDMQLKRFVPAILGLCPNTVIFIYGDHTPSLPKCGYRKSMYEMDQRTFEFVPLFIILPGKSVYREKSFAASFLDVGPTALAVSGIADSICSYGYNLLDLPIRDGDLPYRLGIYSRKTIFSAMALKK